MFGTTLLVTPFALPPRQHSFDQEEDNQELLMLFLCRLGRVKTQQLRAGTNPAGHRKRGCACATDWLFCILTRVLRFGSQHHHRLVVALLYQQLRLGPRSMHTQSQQRPAHTFAVVFHCGVEPSRWRCAAAGDTRITPPPFWTDFQSSAATPHQVRFQCHTARFRKAVDEVFPTTPCKGPTLFVDVEESSSFENRSTGGGCFLVSPKKGRLFGSPSRISLGGGTLPSKGRVPAQLKSCVSALRACRDCRKNWSRSTTPSAATAAASRFSTCRTTSSGR